MSRIVENLKCENSYCYLKPGLCRILQSDKVELHERENGIDSILVGKFSNLNYSEGIH